MNIKDWFFKNKWLLIIIAVASFLRFYHADFQSIWLDEILSMNDSNPSFTFDEFYDGIMFWEFIPHLYFYILKILFQIFGYTALVARIFSGFIGVFGVYAIYLLGREIYNKKAGLLAAILVAVNIFHIQYSQEIRPYGLLFLFTVIAFYRLVVFIKNSSLKNAVIYGFFAGLILNAHFFGFITLFSQYLILLLALVFSEKQNRKKFFLHSFYSAIITIIVFLPVYNPFIRASEISSFWLAKPSIEVYTNLFKEFFGFSEIVLFIVQFIVIYYVINLFNQKKVESSKEKLFESNKQTFGFVILFIWLFISLTIPLVKSYLDLPMILSRYFINILPVLILVIAIGIDLIKNKLIKIIVISVLIGFSLIDVFVVKNYYNTVAKTQFRELTNEIKVKNEDKAKLVCYWSWLFPYFFQDDPIVIEGKTLEDYVLGLKDGTIKNESFWYADANSRPYNLNLEDENFLNENYTLKEKLQFHDAWANYYESKLKFLTAELTVTAQKDDNFTMYYTEDGTVNFNENKAIWIGVTGKPESQRIKFTILEEKIPTHLRFDFGINKQQGNVILKNIKLKYFNKEFQVKGSQFFNYFMENNLIKTEIDEVNGTITFFENKNAFSTPFYYPQQSLVDEIARITKAE